MSEGDAFPIEEIAGKVPPQEKTIFQEANLAWWDGEIQRLGAEMQKDKEYRIKHQEWEMRQYIL